MIVSVVAKFPVGHGSAEARKPLRERHFAESFGEHGTRYWRGEIDAKRALAICGGETEPMCAAMNEDLGTPLWLVASAAWKDELLRRLVADRFGSAADLGAYLDSHGIVFTRRPG